MLSMNKLLDTAHLSSKVFAWLAVFALALLLLPNGVLALFSLDQLPARIKPLAGGVLLASLCGLAVNGAVYFWSKRAEWKATKAERDRTLQAIANLDQAEKAVLREFFVQSQHIIDLPLTHPTVSGLVHKGVLVVTTALGTRGLAGSLFPCYISDLADRNLTPEMIELPLNPTPEEIARIKASRPNFLAPSQQDDDPGVPPDLWNL